MGRIIYKIIGCALICLISLPFLKLAEMVDTSNALGDGVKGFLLMIRMDVDCRRNFIFTS